MIASRIGHIFLEEYNKRNKKLYTSKQFFTEILHPLFYDHPKYMQWITNSPYVQGIRKGTLPTKEERGQKLQKLIEKITNSEPDASIAIGYPSSDPLATTSGQVTDMAFPMDEEDLYASWIGGAFGIGVSGGLSIYFDHPEILWLLYRGWPFYRQWIEETPEMKGNQIETWNGQWISYVHSRFYNEKYPLTGMSECRENIKGIIQLKTQHWTKVVFNLTQMFKSQTIVGYVFSLGQTNITIGFIPFHLPAVHHLFELYRRLFGDMQFRNGIDKIEEAFSDVKSLFVSCEMGSIGINSLQPKSLQKYMPGKGKSEIPKYTDQSPDRIIQLNAYKTWVVAMLNNEELLEKATQVSKVFVQYEAKAKKGRTDRINLVKEILNKPTKRNFIESLIPIIADFDEAATPLQQLVEEVNKMPATQFPYFLTLIKFEYAIEKKNRKGGE